MRFASAIIAATSEFAGPLLEARPVMPSKFFAWVFAGGFNLLGRIACLDDKKRRTRSNTQFPEDAAVRHFQGSRSEFKRIRLAFGFGWMLLSFLGKAGRRKPRGIGFQETTTL